MPGKTLLALTAKLTADTTKFKGGLNKGKKELSGFSKSVGKIGGMIAGAFAVSKIIEFTKESAAMAAEFEGIQAAYNKLDNTTIEELRESVSGTVNDMELMRSTVQAATLGLDQSKMPELFAFAAKRANETGESVDFLVDSIVKGIGRKSPLILDNLGISAIQLKEAMGGTSLAAASVAEVTEAVAKIAAEATQEVDEFGNVILTTKQKEEQLTAETDNFKLALGSLANTLKGELAPALTELMKQATAELNTMSSVVESDAIPVWQKLFGAVLEAQGFKVFDTLEKKIIANKEATEDSTESTEDSVDVIEEQIKSINSLNEEIKANNELVNSGNIIDENAIAVLNDKNTAIEKQIKFLKGLSAENLKRDKPIMKIQPLEFGGVGDVIGDDIDFALFEADMQTTSAVIDELSGQIKIVENEMLDFGSIVSSVMTGVITSFAEGVGHMLSGAESMEVSLGSIASIFGGFLISMGEAIIAYGVAAEAFQLALTNPITAILAGAALVVAGTIVNDIGATGLAEGGIIPPGFPNDTFRANLSSNEAVIPLDRMPEFGNSQPIVLETRVDGNDLLLVHKRTIQKNNRIR